MSKLPTFSDKENPRSSSDLLIQVDCQGGLTVSCGPKCNTIVLTDAEENQKSLFTFPINVYVVDTPVAGCGASDYRREGIGANNEPYVVIWGLDADNKEASVKEFQMSIYPQSGQTAEDLKNSILDAICACTEQIVPDPVEPPFYEDAKRGSENTFTTSSTIPQVVVEKEVPIKAGVLYKLDWSVEGFGDLGEILRFEAVYDSNTAGTSIGQGFHTDNNISSGHWSFDTEENLPEGSTVNMQILAFSDGGGEVSVNRAFISIQEVAKIV